MANLYNKAGLVNIPVGYSDGFLYNIKPVDNTLAFRFDRASSATRVNEKGLIKTVAIDKPRIDYTDSLTSPSFLLEPQSTNLITHSEGYSQWTWGGNSNPNNTTRVDNQSSPDGGLNASLFTRNSGTSGWFSPQNITVSLNNTFTYSIFVKKNNSSTIELNNVSNSPQNKVVYNIDLNTFTTETNATGNSLNYGNGWYRISMTFEHTNSGGTSAQIRHTLEEGKSMFVFGSQAEQKSFVTSYIPTFGSASTRAAETCNGAGNASTFNDSEGVLYAEIAALANDNTYRFISASSGAYANSVRIGYFTTSNVVEFRVVSGGVSQGSLLYTLPNATDIIKIAGKYKQNDFSLWVNGTKVVTDTSGNVPVGLSELAFDDGNTSNNSPFYGKSQYGLPGTYPGRKIPHRQRR